MLRLFVHIIFSMFMFHISSKNLPHECFLSLYLLDILNFFVFVCYVICLNWIAKYLINWYLLPCNRCFLWAQMIIVRICLQPGRSTKISRYQILLAQRRFWLKSTGKTHEKNTFVQCKLLIFLFFIFLHKFQQRKTMWSFAGSCRGLFVVISVQHFSKWFFTKLSLPKIGKNRKPNLSSYSGYRK